MGLIIPRSSRVFPGGPPALNPAHPMTQGIRLAAVTVGQGGMLNLCNGKGTVGHGTISGGVDPIIGPYSLGTGSGAYLSATGINETPTSATVAMIVNPTSTTCWYPFGNNGNSFNASGVYINGSGALTLQLYVANQPALGLAAGLSVGVPYLMVFSYNGATGVGNSILADLANGITYPFSAVHAHTIGTTTAASYDIGGDSGADQSALKIAAVAYSVNNLLSPAQLAAMAEDPWALWYPQSTKKLIFASTRQRPASPSTITQPRTGIRAGHSVYVTDPGLARTQNIVGSGVTQSPGQLLSAPYFTDTDTTYAPTVTTSVTLSPGLVDDSTNDTFYSPTVSGTTILSPGLFSDSDTFYSATISTTASVVPGLMTSDDTIYAPTVTYTNTLSPPLFSDTDTFYSPTVAINEILLPGLVSDSDTIFATTVVTGTPLAPSLVTDSAEVVYTAAVFGTAFIQPALRQDFAETIYSPVVLNVYGLAAGLVTDSAESIYTPVEAIWGILPGLFVDVDTFYVPSALLNCTLDAPFVADVDVIQPGEVFYQTQIGTPGGGGSGGGLPADLKYASSLVLSQSGIIIGLGVISTSAAPSIHVRMGIYDDNSGVPNNLIGFTDILTGVAIGSNSLPVISPSGGVSVEVGQTIWIAVNTDGTMNWFLTTSANGSKFNTNTFTGGLSDPFGAINNDNRLAPVTAELLIGGVTINLTAPLVNDSDETIYAPVVLGVNALLPPLWDETSGGLEAVITPVVGGVDIIQPVVGAVPQDDNILAPTVAGLNALLPPLEVDTDVFLVPQVVAQAPSTSFILSAAFPADDVIYSPTVVPSGANLLVPFIGADDVFYVPTVVSTYGLTSASVGADDTIFAPTVSSSWNISVPLLADTQYEFIYPPTVAIQDTNFTLLPPLWDETNVGLGIIEKIFTPKVQFASELQLTGIILIASEADRVIEDLLGDGSI